MQKNAFTRAPRGARAAALELERTRRTAAGLLVFWLTVLMLAAASHLRGAEIISYTGAPVPIPDAVPAGVEIPITVSGLSGTIVDLDFAFDGDGPCADGLLTNKGLGHPWVGDLVVTLTSPDGRTVTLINEMNAGQGGANFCHMVLDDEATLSIQNSNPASQPFFGNWKPASLLSEFDGGQPNGVWVLRVADVSPADTGTVYDFSLRIETQQRPQNYPPIVYFNIDASVMLTNQQQLNGRFTAFDANDAVSSVQFRVLPSEVWVNATRSVSEEFIWTFSTNLAVGENVIQARGIDTFGQVGVVVQRSFTYDPNFIPPPTVELLNIGTDNLMTSVSNETETKVIQVRGIAHPQISRVEYKTLEGDFWFGAGEVSRSGDGTTIISQFTVNLQPGANRFQVRAVSNQGVFGTPITFLIHRVVGNIPPVAVIVEPDGDRTIPFSQDSYDFKGTAYDADGALTRVEYRVTPETYLNQPQPPAFVAPWINADNASGDWTEWEFTAEGLQTGTSFVEVRATDNEALTGVQPARAITRLNTNTEQGIPVVTIDSPSSDRTVDGATETIQVSGRASAPIGKQIAIVEIRSRGGAYFPAIDTSTFQDWSTWTLSVDLIEGSQLIEVKARTTDGIESLVQSRTIIRLPDPRPRPFVTITDPATNLFLPNTQPFYTFKGTASDLDAQVQRVEFRVAKNIASLGNWRLAQNVSGNWSEWSFVAPIAVFNNIVQVRAVDTDNLIGSIVSRTVFREAALPIVNVTFPFPGFVAFNREGSIQVQGTASDPDGFVTAVRFRVGFNTVAGRDWVLARNDGGNFNLWSFKADFSVGLNIIEIQAEDNSGALSELITLNITRQKAGTPLDLLVLTEFTDVWGSQNPIGQFRFQPPVRFDYTGFHHDPANGWKTIPGDFNGDGLTDLGTTTPFGDFWIALNAGNMQLHIPEKSAFGWAYNEQQGYNTIAGDFDGDGKTDLAMVTPDSGLYVGYNTQNRVPTPVFTGMTQLRFRPSEGLFLYAADLSGDGKDDLIQLDNVLGSVQVARAIDNGFAPVEFWGTPGFKYDPNAGSAVHFGDFNGDGIEDIVQQDEEVWSKLTVALSTGSILLPPSIWGGVGFSNNPNRGKGWWVFVFDATGDGLADLVQLNEYGEFWVSESTGRGVFLPPNKNAILGFEHRPQGPWQVYPADLKP